MICKNRFQFVVRTNCKRRVSNERQLHQAGVHPPAFHRSATEVLRCAVPTSKPGLFIPKQSATAPLSKRQQLSQGWRSSAAPHRSATEVLRSAVPTSKPGLFIPKQSATAPLSKRQQLSQGWRSSAAPTVVQRRFRAVPCQQASPDCLSRNSPQQRRYPSGNSCLKGGVHPPPLTGV